MTTAEPQPTPGRQRYRVPFNDLAIPQAETRERYLAAIERVMLHGRILLGPEVESLEQRIAAQLGRQHACGVGSGTDALMLAFMALGIGLGDEVILPAMSWIASANAVKMVGAHPVFVDVNDEMNIDPALVEGAITERSRAILAVDYCGRVADMDALSALAERHGLALVEDGAQAFGATLEGRPAGSFGVMSCFSMNPMKVFGALGEAGLVATDDPALHQSLLALRYNGMRDRVISHQPGFNGRIDTLQAAILLCRLDELPDHVQRRQVVAGRYDQAVPAGLWRPALRANSIDTQFSYCVRSPQRDRLADALERRGIECKTREWDYLPAHPALAAERVVSDSKAKRFSAEMLCLPIFEGITDDEVALVCQALAEAAEELAAMEADGAR